jgi:hypothetical protein
MPEADALVPGKPGAVAVRAPMMQSLSGTRQCLRRDRFVTREECCYSTHNLIAGNRMLNDRLLECCGYKKSWLMHSQF